MAKGYYEQSCDDFALYSSPWQEHCQDAGSIEDYNQEAYAGEGESPEHLEYEAWEAWMMGDDFIGPREKYFQDQWAENYAPYYNF